MSRTINKGKQKDKKMPNKEKMKCDTIFKN